MKKNKKFIILLLLILVTGCTKTLKDEDEKAVVNEKTGQNLTANILCRPTEEESIKIYEEHGVDLESLPYCYCENDKITKEVEVTNEDGTVEIKTEEVDCESFKISSGKYDGIWSTVFVRPLAYVILFFGNLTKNYGLGLIITSLLIRIIAYPVTRKTAMQSEYMKQAQPEMSKIEKKYATKSENFTKEYKKDLAKLENKDNKEELIKKLDLEYKQKNQELMMQKSQEMMIIYKKFNVSPLSGCLLSFMQLPLFVAFLEAINRVPAIFEETILIFHLGTTPLTGIKNSNYWYILVILLVAVTTYFSFKATKADQATSGLEMKKQQSMMMNMLTIMIIIMSIFMTTALDIYWMTTNLFTICQNIIVKRRIKK